tara:strand:- start:14 stop:151 length:138 start_codon:yes stop_codon:yes gene_type:complete
MFETNPKLTVNLYLALTNKSLIFKEAFHQQADDFMKNSNQVKLFS